METCKNLLRDSIAALRGTRFLAYLEGMSRRCTPGALLSNRSLQFLSGSKTLFY